MTTPSAAPHPWAGLALVCLAGIIWGTIGPAVRLIHDWSGLSPLVISAYRAAAAVIVLLAAVMITGRLGTSWSVARPHWRRVVAVGVLTAAFQLLFFIAVVSAGVSVSTVVCLGFAPVLLLVIGCVHRRRPPSAGSAATVAIALTGLLLVSFASGGGDHAPHPAVGVLAALSSGSAYALGAIVAGPLSHRLDTLTMTTATMSVAAAVLVPGGLGLAALRGDALGTTDPASWAGIGYLGVVTMAVAYAVFFTALRSIPSGAAVVATLIEPVTAVAIAVVFLGEHLTLVGFLGCLLVVAAIASLGRRTEESPPQ